MSDNKKDKLEIVKSVKETADKTKDIVVDSAKTVVDIAEVQLDSAKEIITKFDREFREARKTQKIEKLRLVNQNDLKSDNFMLPRVINVIEYDKKYDITNESETIGFIKRIKSTDVFQVFENRCASLGITLIPSRATTTYYQHPLDSSKYIDINHYFKYIENGKITELKMIAQKLGAKHFIVTIQREENSVSEKDGLAKVGIGIPKVKVKTEINIESESKNYINLRIAAEQRYDGDNPSEPKLYYWKDDETINGLIQQRMTTKNNILSEKYRLEYDAGSYISESEAAKLDAVLKVLKTSGDVCLTKTVINNKKMAFEYLIEY